MGLPDGASDNSVSFKEASRSPRVSHSGASSDEEREITVDQIVQDGKEALHKEPGHSILKSNAHFGNDHTDEVEELVDRLKKSSSIDIIQPKNVEGKGDFLPTASLFTEGVNLLGSSPGSNSIKDLYSLWTDPSD